MAGIRAQVDGIKALRRRLDAVQSNKAALRIIATQGVGEAKRLYVAQSRKTGNLGRTIRVGTVTDKSALVVAGGTAEVGYALYVERGTRPHDIVARNAKVLAWGGPRTLAGRLRKGGRATNFAKRVRHPGSRAKPYLVPGVRIALRKAGLTRAIVNAWNKAA